MGREPVAVIESLKFVARALVLWLVVMDLWPLTEIQQAATVTLLMALIDIVGTSIQRRLVTPVADPRSVDGKKLEVAN
jgi:hypothetical protein